MQLPSHTRESYLAAVRMGAGSLGCEATLLSGATKAFACRTKACDLHLTTNILTHAVTGLKTKACSYSEGPGWECCASKITRAEFKTLCGTLTMQGNRNAVTMDAYIKSLKNPFRQTTVYQDGGCAEVMTLDDYIALANEQNVRMVPELIDDGISRSLVADQTLASDFINTFTTKIDKQYVYPQSSNTKHIKKWLSTGYNNAVFRFTTTDMATNGMSIMDDLTAMEFPIRYVSANAMDLLVANDHAGGSFKRTKLADYLKSHVLLSLRMCLKPESILQGTVSPVRYCPCWKESAPSCRRKMLPETPPTLGE